MGFKNIYFGWSKGTKKSTCKSVNPSGGITDIELAIPRENNRDHNGIICMSYQATSDDEGKCWTVKYAVSFCAPGDAFSRPFANNNFYRTFFLTVDPGLVTVEMSNPIFSAETARKVLMDNVLIPAVQNRQTEMAGTGVPGWLKKAIKKADLGRRN